MIKRNRCESRVAAPSGRRHTRGGSYPTPGIRDPDLFGLLGSVRWDPDLLVNDPDLKEDLDPI